MGLDADKPAAGTAGRFYWATDTKILYRDTGAAWEETARGETVTRLAQLSEKAHSSLTGIGADDHFTHKSFLSGWTADKLLKGAGAGNDPTEIDMPSLDTCYEQGGTITADVHDIIFNLASTYGFKIQDAGTDVFTFGADSSLAYAAPSDLVTCWDIAQSNFTSTTQPSYLMKLAKTVNTADATTSVTHYLFNAQLTVNQGVSGGFAIPVYAASYSKITHEGDISGSPTAVLIYTFGLRGDANDNGGDTSDKDVTRYCEGLEFKAYGKPTVNKSAGTLTSDVRGIFAHGEINPDITAGGFTGKAYGAYVTGKGTTEGTQTAYGIYAGASGADTLYGGYFTPTVFIHQNSTTAAIPCLSLDQDDESEGFIDFLGSGRGAIAGSTNSVESVRVELNGTVYRLALYADA